MEQISERVQLLNDKSVNKDAKFVIYRMQMFKRSHDNHALKFAIEKANEFELPLHTFILEGVEENRAKFEKLGATYLFYLQKDKGLPKQIVKKIAKDAALIVTDDFPCFIITEHNKTIAENATIPVYAFDSNGIIPIR